MNSTAEEKTLKALVDLAMEQLGAVDTGAPGFRARAELVLDGLARAVARTDLTEDDVHEFFAGWEGDCFAYDKLIRTELLGPLDWRPGDPELTWIELRRRAARR